MTDTTTTTLTVEQQQRAEALDRARESTKQNAPFGSAAADPVHLIDVANWILNGRDPLSGYREPDAPLPAATKYAEPREPGVGDQVRGMHPAVFRSGEWATITGVGRGSWRVQFPDGRTDEWAIDDPAAEYQFRLLPNDSGKADSDTDVCLCSTCVHRRESDAR
ncbi:hypothetical protein JVX90_00180 [Gordonia sp. PDNC005]|uniref:hypothetical protein n=1 Tax=Gordonia sp. PDNC005 TaxID=2811424 RepID=UPI0019635480|nr:hypothetical protein [Gordonia sp. PDNC005]QRY62729.1 hypothetical protein JVX90_00180 [Gordonia sp. PDNC005]